MNKQNKTNINSSNRTSILSSNFLSFLLKYLYIYSRSLAMYFYIPYSHLHLILAYQLILPFITNDFYDFSCSTNSDGNIYEDYFTKDNPNGK